MQNILKTTLVCLAVFAFTPANAALVNYTIIGDVIAGDEWGDVNAFGLTAGELITATGIFDDSALTAGSGTIDFSSGSGNTMTIVVGTKTFTASDDTNFTSGFPKLVFSADSLSDFDYNAISPESFNSSGLYFDDSGGANGLLLGSWQTSVTLTAVPVPAAVWLFGSGLLGLVGIARKIKV